jgi:hypothetical protein
MPMSDDNGTSDAEAHIPIRELALRCGELHGKILPMVSALGELSEDELIERGKADLAELRSRERLTDPEMGQLLDVLRVIRTDASPREKSNQVDNILQQIRTSGGSPYALAIAAIAADSSRSMAQRTEVEGGGEGAFEASAAAVVAADVVGGVGGVFIGDALCGVWCAVLGGSAGALGLSTLADEHL